MKSIPPNKFDWSDEKNEVVESKTGVSFKDVVTALELGGLLENVSHPNNEKYGHQQILIVEIKNYAYAVPYVMQDEETGFLKTLFPSRVYNRKYLTKK